MGNGRRHLKEEKGNEKGKGKGESEAHGESLCPYKIYIIIIHVECLYVFCRTLFTNVCVYVCIR